MSNELYQKTGIAVTRLAQDFLSRKVGDRILSISEYQEKFQVSRGTVQNSLNYLKERGAVSLISRGHMGTFIEKLDYHRLQECSFNKEILGSMPLPYSLCYQGLATALYQLMKPYAFNLVYARGSGSRMKLLSSDVCQFAVCSLYAAEEAIGSNADIEIALDLGPGTYLTRHVMIFRDPEKKAIETSKIVDDRIHFQVPSRRDTTFISMLYLASRSPATDLIVVAAMLPASILALKSISSLSRMSRKYLFCLPNSSSNSSKPLGIARMVTDFNPDI
jgi:hypothetical protein